MTAPITPDERAEWRALADAAFPGPWEASIDDLTDEINVVHDQEYRAWVAHTGMPGGPYAQADADFIAAARTAVPRLLDALDTAEAEAAEVREGACVWCDASRADCACWRSEQRACCPDCAHASYGPWRAATSPAWDEDTVTEAVRRAVTGVVANVSNWPDGAQTGLLGRDLSAPIDAITAAVLAVVRDHLPVSGESRATVQAAALRDAADWLADMDDGRDTGQHRAGRDIIARLRDRADRLDPTGADR